MTRYQATKKADEIEATRPDLRVININRYGPLDNRYYVICKDRCAGSAILVK